MASWGFRSKTRIFIEVITFGMVYHMLNNVPREVFFVNALSSGNFENAKRFLGKMWEYISGVPNVVEEKKKKNPEGCP